MTSPSRSRVTTEVDDWGRRKFRLEEGEPQSEARQPQQEQRFKSMLVSREEAINIDKYVGRLEKGKNSKKKQIFYCQLCKQGFTVDIAYISHLNSPHHNSKLGMSMKVKAVSADEVQEYLHRKKYESAKAILPSTKNCKYQKEEPPFGEKQKREEEGQEKQAKVESIEEGQRQESSSQDLEAALRACGLPSSFGSKKQKR